MKQILACSFSLLFLVALAAKAGAQVTEDPVPELQKRIDNFFLALTAPASDPRNAFAELLAGGPLERSDDVKKLVDEVRKFDEKFGAFVEAEQISGRRVGKDLVVFKYLYKGQRFPVVWHFVFYRTPGKNGPPRPWSVISTRFDTRLELLAP